MLNCIPDEHPFTHWVWFFLKKFSAVPPLPLHKGCLPPLLPNRVAGQRGGVPGGAADYRAHAPVGLPQRGPGEAVRPGAMRHGGGAPTSNAIRVDPRKGVADSPQF